MSLKLNLKISNDEITSVKADFGTYKEYDGPIPQPGLYDVKATKMWFNEDKNGDGVLIVRLEFQDEDYKGFSILHRLTVPSSAKDEYFAVRMKSLSDFFRAATDGAMDVEDFVKAAQAGKIIVDKEEKLGQPVTQIAKFKIASAKPFTIKTKPPRTYNGKEYVDVHYIDTRNVGKAQQEDSFEPDVDVDVDIDDDLDVDDDIDKMLGDIDD